MTATLRILAIGAASLAAAVVVATIGAGLVLHDSAATVSTIARYILLSAGVSLVLGIVGIALGMRFLPRLSLKVGLGYGIASLGAIATVLYTPLLMFKETQDLHMLVLMLVSFFVISLGFAAIVGYIVAQHLRSLREAAQQVALGNFDTRVEVPSGDELSELATAFNRMSAEIGRAFERERAADGARRDLVAAISHDLRTPLAAMRAMLEAIQDGVVSDSETVTAYHNRILDEVDRLSRLIDDLFELSRLDAGAIRLDLVPVRLCDLLSEAVDSLRPTAERRGISLRLSVSDRVTQIDVDPGQMQRVLLNLVQNAIRHTPTGGSVEVTAVPAGNRVRIDVVDSGEGIAPDDLPHIFDRFYRGEKSRVRHDPRDGTAGAGLGLAIAKAIVEAHGGSIWAENAPAKGARLVLTLPIASREKGSAAVPAVRGTAASRA